MFGHHVWTMFDTGQTARLGVTFEQPSEKSSSTESKTASVWFLIFSFQQNSLAQVKPYDGTTTVTARLGISPHTSLHSADVPLSALKFHGQQQLTDHKHRGMGTVSSTPLGTALTTLSLFGR